MARPDICRMLIVAASLLAIGALHLSLSTQTSPLHVVHVALGVAALLPILTAAIWFGVPGGILSSLSFAAMYLLHMQLDWRSRPMENANQVGMIAVYLFVGVSAGILVRLQDRERRRRLLEEQNAQREAIVQGLASLDRALGSRDRGTLRHSENVAWLAVEIARKLGLSSDRIETLRLAALVHDIGKIGIRDDILLKSGHLTPKESEEIRKHPLLAAEILGAIRGTEEIARIVVAHHERPDGQGYPRGLTAREIPPEAKVLSVADVYCAVTEERPYNRTRLLSKGEALSLLRSLAGSALDSDAVDALMGLISPLNAAPVLTTQGPLAGPLGPLAPAVMDASSG